MNGSFIMGAGIKRGPVEGDYIEYYDNPSMSYQKPQVQTHQPPPHPPQPPQKPQKKPKPQPPPPQLPTPPPHTTPPLTT